MLKTTTLSLLFSSSLLAQAPSGLDQVPNKPHALTAAPTDWLLARPGSYPARIWRDTGDQELVLSNGLIACRLRIDPALCLVELTDLMADRSLLRGPRPAARLVVDGEAIVVGGLQGQPNQAFLRRDWLERMTPTPSPLRLVAVHHGPCQERFGWKRIRHHERGAAWPPKGLHLRFELEGDGLGVEVHYELYDDLPAFSKWLVVRNKGDQARDLQRLRVEELAVVEHSNWVEARAGVRQPAPQCLHVETDFAFGGFNHQNANRHVVHWRSDPDYKTQVNYKRETPCLLVVEPEHGPARILQPGEALTSFRSFALVQDSSERERRGLGLRRMYRVLAPWVTENPLTHHLLSKDPARVVQAIDEAAEVGFEAVILSFGSGFDLESEDRAYQATWRKVAAHARTKGIELGAYSLFSSRGVGKPHMIVSPAGERPTHGRCPAVTSNWGLAWLIKVRRFYQDSGFLQFENDGPYPGDRDTTARLPLQRGAEDSRWVQGMLTMDLYRDLRSRGVYINAPDYYFLNGSNKCGMGYRETNWSLPRAQQVIHTRQNIYDGTWTKTPSMGWMHVPLAQYHGGGPAATVEPLDQHREHYRRLLLSNLGLGVQAHYRGPRLFDTARTKAVVQDCVRWFKQHRAILESDLIHGRRADGRDLDWMLHANPQLPQKGMLLVFNPLSRAVQRRIRVDLYYTGLRGTAQVQAGGGAAREVTLRAGHQLWLDVEVPAQGMSWYLLR